MDPLHELRPDNVSTNSPLLDAHAKEIERFRRTQEAKQRRLQMEEERRRKIEAKHSVDKTKINNKHFMIEQEKKRLASVDEVRKLKVDHSNVSHKIKSEEKLNSIQHADEMMRMKATSDKQRRAEEIARLEAEKRERQVEYELRRTTMEEQRRQRIEAKQAQDAGKAESKNQLLEAQRDRLRMEDSVWKQRVERANLEEEMRVARKIRELEMKDQALSMQLSADEEHTKHMTAMAERERAEHMQQVQARGAELEELKRMRAEAKLAANATKAENKQTLLRMQRERLKQQDAERQSRTEQAMKDEEVRRAVKLKEIEQKDAALRAQMKAEAEAFRTKQAANERARAQHMKQTEVKRRQLADHKRYVTEAKLADHHIKDENKQAILEMEKQRLRAEDEARQLKVERANMEVEMKAAQKHAQIMEQQKRDALRKKQEEDAKKKSAMIKAQVEKHYAQQTNQVVKEKVARAKAELPERLEARSRGTMVVGDAYSVTGTSRRQSPHGSPGNLSPSNSRSNLKALENNHGMDFSPPRRNSAAGVHSGSADASPLKPSRLKTPQQQLTFKVKATEVHGAQQGSGEATQGQGDGAGGACVIS